MCMRMFKIFASTKRVYHDGILKVRAKLKIMKLKFNENLLKTSKMTNQK